MMRALAALPAIGLFSTIAFAQGAPRTPVEGAWRVTEIVTTGSNPWTARPAQPGLFMFSRTHFSAMWVPGSVPRVEFKTPEPTVEERLAAFGSFIASAGTYELSGNTITARPFVARFPNCAAPGSFFRYQLRAQGDTLWLTQKASDVNCRQGEIVGPVAGADWETRFKLVRVE